MATYFTIGLSVGYFFYDDVATALKFIQSGLYEILISCSKRKKVKVVPSLDTTFSKVLPEPMIYNPISEQVESQACDVPKHSDVPENSDVHENTDEHKLN